MAQLCDLVAPLGLIFRTRLRKSNLLHYILEIQNMYVTVRVVLEIKKVMIENIRF